jgi:serine protease Do
VIRPWFGVKGKFVTDELRKLIALPLVEGLLVLDVEDGSPEEKTGLRAGKLNVVSEGEPWVLGGQISSSPSTNSLSGRMSSLEKSSTS